MGLKGSKNKKDFNEETKILDVLEERKKKVGEKLKKLYLIYADSEDFALDDAIKETKEELKNVENQIRIEKEQQVVSKTEKELKKQLSTLSESWDFMTRREQRNIVKSCVSEITAKENDVRIYYKLNI